LHIFLIKLSSPSCAMPHSLIPRQSVSHVLAAFALSPHHPQPARLQRTTCSTLSSAPSVLAPWLQRLHNHDRCNSFFLILLYTKCSMLRLRSRASRTRVDFKEPDTRFPSNASFLRYQCSVTFHARTVYERCVRACLKRIKEGMGDEVFESRTD
jgi:hypothetical protein